jgi:hypothetical protein
MYDMFEPRDRQRHEEAREERNESLKQNKTVMKLTEDRNALVNALHRITACKSVAVARMIATDALVDAGEMK